MGSAEHAWRCEDEEEAHGVELLLRRAGIEVQVRDDGNETWFEIAPRDAPRAAEFESRIARHFVRADERGLAMRLDARERLTRHVLYGFVAAVLVVLVAY